MAEIRVGPFPPYVSRQTIRNGLEVKNGVYQNAAGLNNWLITRGGQLVPATMVGAMGAGDSHTLHFALYPRAYARHRAWLVGGRPTGTTPFQITITAGSSSTFTFTADRPAAPQIHRQVVSSPDDDVEETSITIACPSGSGAGFVDCLACFEVPRPVVSTTEDLITPEEGFAQGRPIGPDLTTLVDNIYDAGGENSAEAIRRNGLFFWSVPTSQAFTTTSTSYVNVFTLLKPPVLAAYSNLASGAEDRVNLKVYARANGSGGTFRVTTTASGNTQTRSIGATGVWEWWSSSALSTTSFDIATEDLAAVDGRRSSSWDELTMELKADGAATTVDIAAISIGRHKQST